MTLLATYLTPGVYIDEADAAFNSVVPVATAVPVFIGYTPRAKRDGQSCYGKPVRITSFAEYQAFFTVPSPPVDRKPAFSFTGAPIIS